MNARILFRADSGIHMGHGHATRVEALARAALLSGGDARIVARKLNGHRAINSALAPILWIDDTAPVGPDIFDNEKKEYLDMYAQNEGPWRGFYFVPEDKKMDLFKKAYGDKSKIRQ